MSMIARGIVWYGLYLFLILLPIGTAIVANPNRLNQPFLVELGVGAGFIGLSLMALEFSLISRINAAAQPFGEDSLQLFHNVMGMAALGFIIAHPVLLIIAGYPANCWLNPFAACASTATRTALLAVVLLLALIVTSVWRKRLRISYELWYLAHGIFALLILVFAFGHILILGRYTSTPAMQAVWIIYAVLVFSLIIRYKIWGPITNWNKRWEVVENRVERGDARTLVLKPVGHDGFNFQPGQFAWLKIGPTPMGLGQHPISMSSAGDVEPGGTVAFTIKNLGDWSGRIVPSVEPGASMWLDGPHGVFSIDREQSMGYVLIGGGVGITPLHSMCQTMAKRGDPRPVVLFYGARDEENLTLYEQLEELKDKMNLTLVPVLSKPSADWQGETGFISADIIRKYVPEQVRWFKFLICGPKPLMDAMETALPSLGIPIEHILTERFDMV